MLIDRIKVQMLGAMKAGRAVEKEILRVALGEIQTVEARKGAAIPDEEASGIVRKLIKSNRETLEAQPSADQAVILEQEIAILDALLPRTLGADDLVKALEGAGVVEGIRTAANDGQATGIAMKALKAQGANVDGKLVAEVVKKLRSPG